MALNLLIDSNVVLDMFLECAPFFSMSVRAISLSKSHEGKVNHFVSASSVTDIYYLTYKALKNQLAEVLGELRRIENGSAADDELLSTIQLITKTLNGLKGERE